MSQPNPLYFKLVYQLAPAALVSAVGIALLSSLARPVATPPQATPATVAVQTEAVFTPTPKAAAPVAEEQASAAALRPAIKPKPAPQPKVATVETPLPRQPAAAAVPLPVPPPVAAQPAPQPVATPAPEQTGVMARLRGIGSTVARVPQQTYSTVTGWFSNSEPPRPPAEVPQNFIKASM